MVSRAPDYRGIAIIDLYTKKCLHCWRDRPSRHGDTSNGCPILTRALNDGVPPEWKWTGTRWKCPHFKDEGIKSREPVPEQVPGQLPMWEEE